jgi:hypothetical protein
MKKRYRATFLLQLLILVASVGSVMGLAVIFVDGVPLMVALLVFVGVLVALELEVLPTLIEWWVLRWASRHAGPVSSRWFVDLDAEEALARAERRRGIEQNPSLW